MKCNVIINSRAGKGQAVKVWKQIDPIFHASGWSTTVYMTENTDDIICELDDCDCIIAVGGDGTFHNVVNTIIRSQLKIPLGLIPAGTGNALMMDLGCTNPMDAVQRIINGKRRFIDVLEITTNEKIFYSISVVGLGMFSAANQIAEKLRWLKGWRYNVAALWQIIFKQTYLAELKIEDNIEQEKFIAVFAANTMYTGKGIKAAPKAKIDDGLLDLVTIKDGPRSTLLKLFKDFVKGLYLDHELVTYRQLVSFELQTDTPQILNIDGEIKGNSPLSVRVLPKFIELML